MVFSTIKVRGFHLDVYGHVNNARYLEFLEDARWEFLEGHLDLPAWRERGFVFPVVNINVNYRHAAALGDVLEVSATLARVGDKSAVIHQEIRLAGSERVVIDADVTFVCVDVQSGRAVPLDGDVRQILEGLRGA